jgi:predicted nucleic acid-binding protein
MTAIADTGFLLAATDRTDTHHRACAGLARTLSEPVLIPVTVLP